MSREIKYRAWDKTAKKMLDWDMLLTAKAQMSVFWEPEKYDIVLMQYTGLKDKNGKEIYEGDIVEFRADGQSIGRNGWQKGVVRWDIYECGWIYCTTGEEVITREQCYHPIQDCDEPSVQNEVIGNIYENKDLLKGEPNE